MNRHKPDPGRIEVVDDRIATILRSKSPAERLAMAFAANRTVRLVIAGAVRSDHPDWDETAVSAEVAKRMLRGTT
jgi:hypothetical protein